MALSKITDLSITDDTIKNADINSSAAIALTKLSGGIDLAASGAGGVTGTLPVGNGGTGATTLAAAGLANTPNFFVYKASSGQSIADSTDTVLDFDTETFDSDSDFASNKFTPTTAGKYYLEALIVYPTAADFQDCTIRIKKNGATVATYNSHAFHYETRLVSVIVEANGSSDYFEAVAYQNSGGSVTLEDGDTGRNYFSGFKLIE